MIQTSDTTLWTCKIWLHRSTLYSKPSNFGAKIYMKQRERIPTDPQVLPLVLPFFAIFCPCTTIFAHVPPYVPILTKVKGKPLFFIPPSHLEVKTLEFWGKNIYETKRAVPLGTTSFAPGFALFPHFLPIYRPICPCTALFCPCLQKSRASL